MKKKQPKIQVSLLPSPDLEQSIAELADAVIDGIKSEQYSDLEPFEHYIQRVRLHIFDSVRQYRDRFVNGYEILLEEIEKEEDKN